MNVHIENRDILAHRVARLMEQKGMSQDLLALKAGISQSLISKILSEKRGAIRHSTLQRIATALEADIRDFVEAGRSVPTTPSLSQKSALGIEQTEKFAKSAKVTIGAAIGHVEQWVSNHFLMGIPTGFNDLDRILLGFENGKMIAVTGRPSLGKTAFILNIINHVAVEKQLPVGMISLDMTAESAILRILCMRAEVNLRSLREGFLAERDFPRLTLAAGKISTAPLYIDDSSGLTVDDIVARARRMKVVYGIRLLVIDYLQLIRATSRRAELNREVIVSDISISLKALAKELMIPIVIVCSLPSLGGRAGRAKPSESLDSSVISQDADVVLILERNRNSDLESEEDALDDFRKTDVVVWKHRDGPTGTIQIRFDPILGRFENLPLLTSEDIPQG
jgi:replicative DNA helicase